MAQSLMVSLTDKALVEDRCSGKARAVMLFEYFHGVCLSVFLALEKAEICHHLPAIRLCTTEIFPINSSFSSIKKARLAASPAHSYRVNK